MGFIDWLAHHHGPQIHPYGFEHGRPEKTLIPGHVLVYDCSFLDCVPDQVVDAGVLLAEIGHDSSTFAQGEVAILQNGDLPNRVHFEVVLLSLVPGHHVNLDERAGDFSHVEDCFDCSSRLAAKSPV